MRSYSLIVFVALTTVGLVALSGCTENHSHHGSTPSRRHVGSTWAVSVFSVDNQLVGSMVVRLTSEKASSCIVGEWKQVEILKRQLKGPDFLATEPLSFSIDLERLRVEQRAENLHLEFEWNTRGDSHQSPAHPVVDLLSTSNAVQLLSVSPDTHRTSRDTLDRPV